LSFTNVCTFNYFTYADTGATTWNEMPGRAAQASAGTAITLGSASTKSECAKLCLTYPHYTIPCMAAELSGTTCTGYPNPEKSFEGTSIVAGYSAGTSSTYLEPVDFTETPLTDEAADGSDSTCTHLAAHNKLWGHVAQCKLNKGYQCELDDTQCKFIPNTVTLEFGATLWDRRVD